MQESVVSHLARDKEDAAVGIAERVDEVGFDRAGLLRWLEAVPPELRQLLAAEAGPGWLWWYGPDEKLPTMQLWHFSGLLPSSRDARPFTPHPDAPVATRGNPRLSIWLPASPGTVNRVTIHLVGRQRFWRMTMNRALDLKISHSEYEATMSLGEALRMLMGAMGEVDVRELCQR